MGFFDKLKSAVNAATGGGGKVTISYEPQTIHAGETVSVRITATSTGSEIKSKGAYVDVRHVEHISLSKNDHLTLQNDVTATKTVFEQEFPLGTPFVLAANETKVFEGTFTMPANMPPTYRGHWANSVWEIRGRIEATGNDPDSGFLPFTLIAG